MKQMFKAMPNSPITRLTETITADATTIPVLEGSKLPTGPNIAVLGIGADSETIIYEANSSGTLTGVTRGVEGTKREWPKGTEIARFYTAYDHNAFIENILGIMGIVESGSNSNGSYRMFADGTMMCWIDNFRLSTLGVSNYYITDVWTFPHKFIEPPAVFPVGEGLYTTVEFASLIVGYTSTTETTTRINAWKRDSGKIAETDRTKAVNVFAIGRWK